MTMITSTVTTGDQIGVPVEGTADMNLDDRHIGVPNQGTANMILAAAEVGVLIKVAVGTAPQEHEDPGVETLIEELDVLEAVLGVVIGTPSIDVEILEIRPRIATSTAVQERLALAASHLESIRTGTSGKSSKSSSKLAMLRKTIPPMRLIRAHA